MRRQVSVLGFWLGATLGVAIGCAMAWWLRSSEARCGTATAVLDNFGHGPTTNVVVTRVGDSARYRLTISGRGELWAARCEQMPDGHQQFRTIHLPPPESSGP